MRYCRNCGIPLEDGVKFCTECGAKVEIIEQENDSQTFVDEQPFVEESYGEKSFADKVETVYEVRDRMRFMKPKSKPFNILCIVMTALTLPFLLYGIFTKEVFVIFPCCMELFVIGISCLFNNVQGKHVRFGAPRVLVIAVITPYIMVLGTFFMALNMQQMVDDGFFEEEVQEEDVEDSSTTKPEIDQSDGKEKPSASTSDEDDSFNDDDFDDDYDFFDGKFDEDF